MKIEVFPSRIWAVGRKLWYFRLVAENGKTVAQSEGYRNKADCIRTALNIRAKAFDAELVSL